MIIRVKIARNKINPMVVYGVISLGVIIPQFLFYPDVPSRQKPDRVFTERVSRCKQNVISNLINIQEIELARDRIPREGRVIQGAFTLPQIKGWFLTPDIVCHPIHFQHITTFFTN